LHTWYLAMDGFWINIWRLSCAIKCIPTISLYVGIFDQVKIPIWKISHFDQSTRYQKLIPKPIIISVLKQFYCWNVLASKLYMGLPPHMTPFKIFPYPCSFLTWQCLSRSWRLFCINIQRFHFDVAYLHVFVL
jgi:hypothetical protein